MRFTPRHCSTFWSASGLLLFALLICSAHSNAAALPIDRAKDLFFQQLRQPSTQLNNGLAFCVELHRKGEPPRLCNTRAQFKSGDGIKLHLKPNFSGYAYVVMTSGSTGRNAVLYPPGSTREDNYLTAGKEYVVPASGVLRFDDNAGVEKLKVLLSRKPMNMETALAVAKSVFIDGGNIDSTNEDDAGFSVSLGSDANMTKPAAATYVVSSKPEDIVAINFTLSHGPGLASPVQPAPPMPAQSSPALPQPPGDVNRPVTDKWALCIGIGKFMVGGNDLKSPAKDAKDLASFLVREDHFAPSHVKTLLDEQATKSNILNNIETWLGQRARPDDLVIVYISSHGTDKSRSGGNYVVPYDFTNDSSGIRMQDLGNLIKSKIASDRIVVLLDVCFAGNAKSKSLDTKDYLDDVLQGAGRVIVSACDVDETSLDLYNRYQNSLFTYHLIQCLRRQPKLKQAFLDTREAVIQDAIMFRSKQTPIINYDRWKGNDVVLSAKPTNPQP